MRAKKKKGMFLFLTLAAAALGGCAHTKKEAQENLRCIMFYSSVRVVNSTISFVAHSLEEQLKDEDGIWLSAYQLPDELYGSLEYKVDTAIALDMDVAILNSAQSEDDMVFYERLTQAGIPFILVDGDAQDTGRCAYIGTDNFEAGKKAAKIAQEQSGDCKVGIVSSPIPGGRVSTSRKQRIDGFSEKTQEQEHIEIVSECVCETDTLRAMQTIREFLDEYPQINTLYCADSASGIAAAKVVQERGIEDEMFVICFDMPAQVEEEIQNGTIDAALVQDTEKIGEACAGVLRQLKQDCSSIQNETISIDCKVVTKESLGKDDR